VQSALLSLLVVDDDASIRRVFREIVAPREEVSTQSSFWDAAAQRQTLLSRLASPPASDRLLA